MAEGPMCQQDVVMDIHVWPDETFVATICRTGRVTIWDLERRNFCLVMSTSNWYREQKLSRGCVNSLNLFIVATLCATIVSPEEDCLAMTLGFASNTVYVSSGLGDRLDTAHSPWNLRADKTEKKKDDGIVRPFNTVHLI